MSARRELDEEELAMIGGRRQQPTGRDDRAWVRFPCDAEATYRPCPSSEPGEWQAQVVDISANGIRLVVSRAFQPGSMLNVTLPAPADEPFRTALACVVHVNPGDDNTWSLGCSFASVLGDEDLRAFGASRIQARENDCRTWVRCPCSMEMAIRAAGSIEDRRWPAKILNISANGVGLLVTQPVEPGALLNVELVPPNRKSFQTLLACVVYAKETRRDQWILGCTFSS